MRPRNLQGDTRLPTLHMFHLSHLPATLPFCATLTVPKLSLFFLYYLVIAVWFDLSYLVIAYYIIFPSF